MNWKEIYKGRTCTVEEAISHIRSGERVVVAHACAEPVVLTDAMTAAAKKYDWRDVEIVHMVAMGKSRLLRTGDGKTFST